MNILATYPTNRSNTDYVDFIKEVCEMSGESFKENMITDEGFQNWCDNEDVWDYDDFMMTIEEEIKKTKIKSGFLEILNGGWQNQHGFCQSFDIDAQSVVSKICGSNPNITIKVLKEGHKLKFIRYSHDEPTGAQIILHSKKEFNRVESEVLVGV
jgi:hypothetical protein